MKTRKPKDERPRPRHNDSPDGILQEISADNLMRAMELESLLRNAVLYPANISNMLEQTN